MSTLRYTYIDKILVYQTQHTNQTSLSKKKTHVPEGYMLLSIC